MMTYIFCLCGHTDIMHFKEYSSGKETITRCAGKDAEHEAAMLKAYEEWESATDEQKENWHPSDDFVPNYCECNEFRALKKGS